MDASICNTQPGGGASLGGTLGQSYPIMQTPRAATAGAPTWGFMGGDNTGTGAAPTPMVSGPTQATAGPLSYLAGGANKATSVPAAAVLPAGSAGADNAAAAASFGKGGGGGGIMSMLGDL